MDATGGELPIQAGAKVPYAVGTPLHRSRLRRVGHGWQYGHGCAARPSERGRTSYPGAVSGCQAVSAVPQRTTRASGSTGPRTGTVIVIHEESGTWAIHGLGNQGVRVPKRIWPLLRKRSRHVPGEQCSTHPPSILTGGRVLGVCFEAGQTGDAGRPRPVTGLAFHAARKDVVMAGRHRHKHRRVRHAAPPRAVEVVDARTLTGHFLTLDALAAGRLPHGRCTALCGQDVLPACLAEPGSSRCPSCVSIPRQQSRSS